MSAPAQQIQEGELMPPDDAPKSAVVEYTKTEVALAELRTRLKNVVFDVKTTAGDKAARTARKELVSLRTALDEKRLELNAEDQKRIRGRNAEAERITTEIKALEEPLDSQIKAEETRKANEKKVREEAEAARVALIRGRIEDDIRAIPLACIGRSARDIGVFIADIEAMVIDHTFAEFQKEAEGAKATTLIRLRAAHTNAVNMEAEQARLAAERAENERIRLENEEAARVQREQLAEAQRLAKEELERERLRQQAEADVERARIAEEERVAKVARDAEAARQAEILRLQREENDRIERERQEAHEVEARRIATERAEAERIEAERQVAREADERRLADERARLERDQEELRAAQALAAAPLPAPVAAVVDEPAAESDLVAPEPVTETAGDDDPESLTASIDLKELLMMQSVCQFAQVWAAFQERDSKLDQKTDRKLAQQAREAEANLLAVIEQLPAHYGP